MTDCMDCKFWKRRGAINGECRRYPPTPIIIDLEATKERVSSDRTEIGVWPITQSGDGCGEWRRR